MQVHVTDRPRPDAPSLTQTTRSLVAVEPRRPPASCRARRFYLCFSSSAHIDFSLWREKKKFKEYAHLWTSSRGQVLSSTVAEEETDCSTKNNSIMETDGEGKFVSFKVVLGGTSLFKMNHGPAGLDCLVCCFYWSS